MLLWKQPTTVCIIRWFWANLKWSCTFKIGVYRKFRLTLSATSPKDAREQQSERKTENEIR
jgi:hypothetical protein